MIRRVQRDAYGCCCRGDRVRYGDARYASSYAARYALRVDMVDTEALTRVIFARARY